MNNDPISSAQQRAAGLLRHQANYVPATHERTMPTLPVNAAVTHVIDVVPTATQHVEMRTNAVDRAKGFLIASVPLYAGFGLVVVLVCVFYAGVPFLSLPTLLIFWLSFVAAWIIGYCYTLSVSAEGVSHMEARGRLQILEREQAYRWHYYERWLERKDNP